MKEGRESKGRTGLYVCLEGEKERMKERMGRMDESVSGTTVAIKIRQTSADLIRPRLISASATHTVPYPGTNL